MKLENQRYLVTFCEQGGEIESFIDKQTGIQYMWQGDTTYWSGKNPTLFPIVGNTYHGTYDVQGKTYQMKNHGLIRYAKLPCFTQSNKVTFTYSDNVETRKQYPFSFHYQIDYELEGSKLCITYHITNTDTVDMPFGFGLHPAFRCPLTSTQTWEDYRLIFEKEEKAQQIVFDVHKQKKPYRQTYVGKELSLSYDLFETYDTLIFENLKSTYVVLQGKEHGVKVSFAGFPYLAFWTPKKHAPLLCIEPWYSHTDFYDTKMDFDQREGMKLLAPGEVFTCSYTIEVF